MAKSHSEWCKKELSAGLIRELEEKRVVVLPLLLEDCQIPIFLRDKLYADFRTNYDEGLRQVLEGISKVTSDTLGRVEEPEWYIDWAIDWATDWDEIEENFWLRLTLVEQAEDQPYSIQSILQILCNNVATARYRQYVGVGLESFGRLMLLELLRTAKQFAEIDILITDNFPQKRDLTAHDPKTGAQLHGSIICRRLGQDTGRDILLHFGQQVCGIIDHMQHMARPLTHEECRVTVQVPKSILVKPGIDVILSPHDNAAACLSRTLASHLARSPGVYSGA